MLTYLLQTSTCLIILYGIYHFILAEMTFFKYNRAYLLLSILASLMIPILAPLLVLPNESVPLLHWSHLAGDITYIVADDEVDVFDWKGLMGNVLWVIYFVGVGVVLIKMIYGLSKIYRYHTYGQKEDFNGYRIITTEAVHLPFSFFNSIYISRHVPLQDHIHTILEHEEIHIRQWHTLDVLMAEMVHAFFWFNPVMIFYKRALRQAHEYLADDLICRKNSVSSYTELLLSKSQSGLELALTNQFFHSQIKKRIQMMTTHKTNRSAAWKYALVLPLLLGLVVLFSSSTVKQQLQEVVSASQDSIPKPAAPPPPPAPPAPHLLHGNALMPEGVIAIIVDEAFIKVDLKNGVSKYYYKNDASDMQEFENFYGQMPMPPSAPPAPLAPKLHSAPPAPPTPPNPPVVSKEVFKVAGQMPRFPGCEGEPSEHEKKDCSNTKMLDYIYSHLKYPAEAKDKSIEGTVVAQFTINKDGSVSDINIVREIGGDCGKAVIEMLQTMNNMPEKWVPGKQEGKNVNVLYTLPVKFKMTDDEPKSKFFIATKTDEKVIQEAFKTMLEMAAFPGSEHIMKPMERLSASGNMMSKFIQKHLEYPTKAKENKIEGTVYIRMTIDTKGKVTEAMIKEDIGYGCGEEALKVVKMMPDWYPATKDGKAVASMQTIPIAFKLKSDGNTETRSKNNIDPKNINIFPNPTTDLIELSLTGSREDVEVSILDMTGKLLYKNKFDNRQEHFNTKIDISQINVPTILVKTVQGNKVSTSQVVIRK
jgi:TonB family protein